MLNTSFPITTAAALPFREIHITFVALVSVLNLWKPPSAPPPPPLLSLPRGSNGSPQNRFPISQDGEDRSIQGGIEGEEEGEEEEHEEER